MQIAMEQPALAQSLHYSDPRHPIGLNIVLVQDLSRGPLHAQPSLYDSRAREIFDRIIHPFNNIWLLHVIDMELTQMLEIDGGAKGADF